MSELLREHTQLNHEITSVGHLTVKRIVLFLSPGTVQATT